MRTFAKVVQFLSRLVFLLIVVSIITGVVYYFLSKPGDLPTLEEAPWAVQTFSNDQYRMPSRFYLANKVDVTEDGTTRITTYWTFDGKGYNKHDGEKTFPKEIYGEVDIRRRKQ